MCRIVGLLVPFLSQLGRVKGRGSACKLATKKGLIGGRFQAYL
jgi:hypothetical protein